MIWSKEYAVCDIDEQVALVRVVFLNEIELLPGGLMDAHAAAGDGVVENDTVPVRRQFAQRYQRLLEARDGLPGEREGIT